MFTQLEMAPADPILGLEEAFKKDPNPRKVNLGVGVYKDESGSTPIFEAVKKAEQIILAQEKTKNYLPINGSPEYAKAVQNLVLGADNPILSAGRATTVHTPGGTGGLRVAADFLKKVKPDAKVWISSPTWPNHPNIFRTAGLAVETYPYYDSAANRLGFETMLNAIQQIPNGDVLLLHGSCHNPTGSDPTPAQWTQIAEVVTARKLLPLIDFAYQGLGEGLRQDAAGVEILAAAAPELLIASSFSKNFGLYNERVGALTLVAENTTAAAAALSHLKICVRASTTRTRRRTAPISSPPSCRRPNCRPPGRLRWRPCASAFSRCAACSCKAWRPRAYSATFRSSSPNTACSPTPA